MLKLIKILLIIVLLFTCLGAGFYYAINHFPLEKFNGTGLNIKDLQPIANSSLGKASELLPKNIQIGSVLGSHVSSVLSSQSSSIPVQQQALEYVRYTYCQQVVADYQQRYGTESGKRN